MRDRIAAAAGRDVSRETFERFEAYVTLLLEENQQQNLVARSTLDRIWERHVLDSAQLVSFEPSRSASWLDIGSGAGLPGIVIAALVDGPVALVEPRRLRAEFLQGAVNQLGLSTRVSVHQCRIERFRGQFDVITARAVAPLGQIFRLAHHLSHPGTVWVLPKGRSAQSELVEAQQAWQGVFHVEQSVTDADARILVATGVRAKQG